MKRRISLLLAVVMVLGSFGAVFASEVKTTEQVAAEFLVEKGILKGNTSGDLGLDKYMKRQDSVIMLSRLMGEEDAAEKHIVTEAVKAFKDVKNPYYRAFISWAVEKEYFKGKTPTKFGNDEDITARDYAVVLLRALGHGEEVATGEGWKNAFETATKLGLLKDLELKAEDKITRGQMSVMTVNALRANVKDGDKTLAEELGIDMSGLAGEIAEFKAVDTKTLEVKFTAPVEDTSKVTVELLRGTFKQNAKQVWSDDRQTLRLSTVGNLMAGEYTVNVKGLAEEVLTAKTTVEAQKVAKIELLSDKAALTEIGGNKATVGYRVLDQYGTDITKNEPVTVNGTSKQDGKIEIEGTTPLVVGTKYPVVIVHRSGIVVSETVEISQVAVATDMSVKGVFNIKGEEVKLNDRIKDNDLYLVLDVKDQYGNKVTDAEGILVSNTNPFVVELDSNISKVKIGNEGELAVKITKVENAGEAVVMLISTTSGQSSQYTIAVAETTTTDKVTLSAPEIAVVGEETLIPVTVLDREGKVILDKNVLTDKTKGFSFNSKKVTSSDIVIKDSQVFVKHTFDKSGIIPVIAQSATYNVDSMMVTVNPEAKATIVTGVKDSTVLKLNGRLVLSEKNVIVEDQYGRKIDIGENDFEVKIGENKDDVIALGEDGKTITAKKKGTATVRVSLKDLDNSVLEVEIRVTDGKEFVAYEIEEIGKVKAKKDEETKNAKDFVVNGILNDGNKMPLDAAEFTATVDGAVQDNGKISVELEGKEDVEKTLRVVINATGTVVEKKFTLSNEARKAVKLELDKDAKDAKSITDLKDKIKDIEDQYGDEVGKEEVKFLVVPEDPNKVTITANGTNAAEVELAEDVKEATVTVKLIVGDVVEEVVLNITPATESK